MIAGTEKGLAGFGDASAYHPPEYLESEHQLDLKRRILQWLIWHADRVPMNQRPWFRISEIADCCARIPGSVEVHKEKRERAIELLRKSILSGEFEDTNDRSRVANVHPDRLATLRFARDSAAVLEWFLPLAPYLWIRRADCEAWFKRNGIMFPKDWGTVQNSGAKKRNSGRKSKYAASIRRAVFKLMDHNGDLSDDDPEWSTQADVERAVHAKLGDDAPRAESTLRSHVSKFIAEWKKSKTTEGR